MRRDVLALIAEFDGQFDYYRLDRMAARRKLPSGGHLIAFVDELIAAKLVVSKRLADSTHSRYWITAAGRSALANGDDGTTD